MWSEPEQSEATSSETSSTQKSERKKHIIVPPTLLDWHVICGKCNANTQKWMSSECQTEQTQQINKTEELRDYCSKGGLDQHDTLTRIKYQIDHVRRPSWKAEGWFDSSWWIFLCKTSSDFHFLKTCLVVKWFCNICLPALQRETVHNAVQRNTKASCSQEFGALQKGISTALLVPFLCPVFFFPQLGFLLSHVACDCTQNDWWH